MHPSPLLLQRFAVPVEEFTANLVALVKKLRKAGVQNVLLLTPPPVNDKVGGVGVWGGRGQAKGTGEEEGGRRKARWEGRGGEG